MMAGNPNWWSSMSNMHHHHHLSSQYIPTTTGSSSQLPFNSLAGNSQDFPQSWSQLLMEEGGEGNSNEDRYDASQFQTKKMEIWEEDVLNPSPRIPFIDAKLEALLSQQSHQLYGHQEEQLFQASRPPATWSRNMHVLSYPARSCISSPGNNNSILEFSDSSKTRTRKNNQVQDHTSECMSTATNGVCKKAKVQSSSLPPLKVRKEKLGDRITALHQLVSPFGRTDTASVLLETIGYIRFLQSQIEALCSPYLGQGSEERNNQNSVEGERNFVFPKDPGGQEGSIDLRSRGLSLVPISYTNHVGSDNEADLWTPAAQGEF